MEGVTQYLWKLLAKVDDEKEADAIARTITLTYRYKNGTPLPRFKERNDKAERDCPAPLQTREGADTCGILEIQEGSC